jgi:hypothetical protein
MDRRIFLVGAMALAGCGRSETLAVVCDPDLEGPLRRALETWSRTGGAYDLEALPAKALLERGETVPGLVIVTREPKLADRLQRTGVVRLRNRWKPTLAGGEAQVVVTRGPGEARGAALGKWLMSDEAAAALTAP